MGDLKKKRTHNSVDLGSLVKETVGVDHIVDH
jgi:hypothetical protein